MLATPPAARTVRRLNSTDHYYCIWSFSRHWFRRRILALRDCSINQPLGAAPLECHPPHFSAALYSPPIFKTIWPSAYQDSNAHGVSCMNLVPFVADLVEDVFTRSKLIQFLNENRSVYGCDCAPDWRGCRKGNRRSRRMIYKRKNVVGFYSQYRLTGVLLSAGA